MARRFSVFGTIGMAARIYARNLLSIAVLSVLVYSPLIVYSIWGIHDAMQFRDSDDRVGIVVIVMFAGTYLLSKVLAGALAFGVFNQLRETRFSLAAGITNGVRRLVPVLLTCLVLLVLIGIATVTYILPGIVAICLTYVAVPAAVVEGGGPFKAFARSVRLVDKDLPRVFMLLVTFVAFQFGLYWGLLEILDQVVPTSPVPRVIAIMTLTIFCGAFDAVLSSVAYANLRVDREGIGVAELANVFD